MKFLRILGKLLISVGVGVLLFVAWVLWGTGIYTGQQQDALRDRFERELTDAPPPPPASDDEVRLPKGFLQGLQPGDPVFLLRIPKADVNHVVVEGVGTEELRKGPGHYPQCRPGFDPDFCTKFPEAFPGQPGRVIVSGHRTTYGQPFWDLQKLEKGDEIFVRTRWGDFTYRVTESKIVLPTTPTVVVREQETSELVLTTCNPRFSAAERLVVYAEMQEEQA